LVATELAGAVSFAPGKPVRGVDIRLRRGAVYCVRGEVRDSSGKLSGQVALGLETEGFGTGVLSEGGRFLLTNLPPGTYTVSVTDRPQMGRVLARQRFAVRDRNPGMLVIRLPAAP
ncbi:MAG: carboxypeptidase-like regulatory domain-containing protein, partial [Acidobacteria bacterium]|nr:carboxypeptidase-like regulatory domain-containing protein [Acidobacteriota bacterium]